MTSTDQPSVLIVEDDTAQAVLLEEFLRFSVPDGIAIERVATLGAGLELLAGGHFDVIVTDLSLPDSVGPDTVVRLRAGAPTVPVVVMSGRMGKSAVEAAREAGAVDYVVKGQVPYDQATVRILAAAGCGGEDQ